MPELLRPENYEAMKPKVNSMAVVGHTTCSSVRLWARAYKSGKWWMLVSEEKIEESIYNLSGKSPEQIKNEHTYVIDVKSCQLYRKDGLTCCYTFEGLESERKYYYYFIGPDSCDRRVELGGDHQHWFRTLPKEPSRLRFGFYSCHDPYSVKPTNEGAWESFCEVLGDREAHFVIGGGDQVYCDTNDETHIQDVWSWLKDNKKALIEAYSDDYGRLDEAGLVEYFVKLYRTYYRVYWNFENLRAVYRRFPQYMIWDDHEIMDGWGSLKKEEREEKLSRRFRDDDAEKDYKLVMLMFRAASRVYWEYQHSHNPETKVDFDNLDACQWDYNFDHGDFAFYALDMRGHHDCEKNSFRLLGKDQFERFKSWVLSRGVAKKKAIFIVSPVPIVHWNETVANTLDIGSVKDDFMDEWGHETNFEERNQVLDLLLKFSDRHQVPVVVLSGDVHCASAFRISHSDKYKKARLFNVTSSAVSRHPASSLSDFIMQGSADISGYNGYFEKLYSVAGKNNFAFINAYSWDGDLTIGASLYRSGPESDDLHEKYIPLV
ncbi:alkaline phosphatase D family protein [Halomonas elongata]|uniref:alkaline phosphatase D family protein n=1 Tax=Halomonas elongata TaxID=2746 RepID=UPI00255B18D0|nr:alkaline phosphatase D family protein [Halomonas elongata]MDL4861673.1 alkaline phosphatase D family protein [Halomonas elongata]